MIEILSATEVIVDGVQMMTSQAIQSDPAQSGAIVKAFLRWHEDRESGRASQAERIAGLEEAARNAEVVRDEFAQTLQLLADARAGLETANNHLNRITSEANSLRVMLGNHILGTSDGAEAMREFKRIALTASIHAQQAELDQLK